MSIIIEAITIVVNLASSPIKDIDVRAQLMQGAVPESYRSDDELLGMTYLHPDLVAQAVGRLERAGLVFKDGSEAHHFAVVDQHSGAMQPCRWLRFGTINLGQPNKDVSFVMLDGSKQDRLVCPIGWEYETSLTNQAKFVSGR